MAITLNLLCAGAAQGLVTQLAPRLLAELDVVTSGRFGAVGAMQEAFEAAEPCDVMVSTSAMVQTMVAQARLQPGSHAPLGRVRTGVAVRRGDPLPSISTPAELADVLSSADALFFPDPQRATAGIHFARVLRELGVHERLAQRFKTFPNGATAMRELGACGFERPIGCTQITEILYTPSVQLIAALPREFELATVYTAAVSSRAAHPQLAARFIELLAGPSTLPLRTQCGFEA